MTKPIQLKENEILDGLNFTIIDAYNEQTEEDIEYYVPGSIKTEVENFINSKNRENESMNYSKYRNFLGVIYDSKEKNYLWRYDLCIDNEFTMETEALTEKELKQLIEFINLIKENI